MKNKQAKYVHKGSGGYLLKKTSVGIFRKRFFEINGNYLTYYKTEKKRKMCEALSIVSAASIRLIDGTSSSSESKTILIDMRDRQYELLCDTVEDAQAWLKDFQGIRDAEIEANRAQRAKSLAVLEEEAHHIFEEGSISTKSHTTHTAQKSKKGFIEYLCKPFSSCVTT